MEDVYINIFEKLQKHVYLLGVANKGGKKIDIPLDVARGTAFAVSKEGHFLTAHHLINKDYKEIITGKKIIGLTGIHSLGLPREPTFEVEVIKDYPNYDIVLLQGKNKRNEYIKLGSSLSLPGAWIATIGYPLSQYDPIKDKVWVSKRIVSAIISQGHKINSVRKVEIDKHLSHGHSGGPILTLKGIAIGVATEYEKGWSIIREFVVEEGTNKEKIRHLQLPVQFSRGTLIHNIAEDLREKGIEVIEGKSRKKE